MAFHRTVRTMKPSHVGRMGGVGQESCYLFFPEKELYPERNAVFVLLDAQSALYILSYIKSFLVTQ